MACDTQRLPVRAGPEQLLIALMRRDVVNHRGGDDISLRLAMATQRMFPKEHGAGLLPLGTIATLGCGTASFVLSLAMFGLMLLAVSLPGQCAAPGDSAWLSRQVRHHITTKRLRRHTPQAPMPISSARLGLCNRREYSLKAEGGSYQETKPASSTARNIR